MSQPKSTDNFLFLHENNGCGYLLERLTEALLTSTHNICFYGEIRQEGHDGPVTLTWAT